MSESNLSIDDDAQTDNNDDGGRVQGGEVGLRENAGDPFDEDDPGPWVVHGLALPADEVTRGASGEPTYWPPEVVANAAELLEGRPVIRDHPRHPSIDDALGEVTATEYIDGLGLAWQGEIDDRDVAKQIHRGRLQASPYLFRMLGEFDAKREAHVASEILAFRDLGVVIDGAGGESVEIETGPHPELALADANGATTTAAEALSAAFAPDSLNGRTKGKVNDISEENKCTKCNMSADNDDGELATLPEDELNELRDEVAQLREENDLLRRPYVEELTRGTPLTPDDVTVSTAELVERFGEPDEDADEDSRNTTLTAEPITGGPAETPGSEDTGADALSADPEDVELARKLQDDIETLGESAPEALRQDVAELVGVDDYDEAVDLI